MPFFQERMHSSGSGVKTLSPRVQKPDDDNVNARLRVTPDIDMINHYEEEVLQKKIINKLLVYA